MIIPIDVYIAGHYLQLLQSRDHLLHQLGHLVRSVQVDQLLKLLNIEPIHQLCSYSQELV